MTNNLKENIDFYYDAQGFTVFTQYYLTQRGFCCSQGCRHCPYGVGPGEPDPEPVLQALQALESN